MFLLDMVFTTEKLFRANLANNDLYQLCFKQNKI